MKGVDSMLVVLDPGHDYKTAGKRSPDGSLLEYEFNQAVADLAEQILVKKGVKVIKTKTMNWTCGSSSASAQNADLARRVRVANNASAPLFISLHANAHINSWTSARGFEVYSYPGSSTGKNVASLVHKYTYPRLKKFGVPDRGLKQANFHVIRETKMPAALIEFEFFTNKEGCALLKRSDFRLECARGVAQAVLAYFKANTSVDGVSTSNSSGSSSSNKLTAPKSGTYTVKKGDTLWGVSQDTGVSVANLKKYNGLKSDTIHAGLVLKLSSGSSSSNSNPVATNGTYVVKSGDTLWAIAQANNTTVDKLREANNLKSDTLSIGQKLVMTAPKTTTKPADPYYRLKLDNEKGKQLGAFKVEKNAYAKGWELYNAGTKNVVLFTPEWTKYTFDKHQDDNPNKPKTEPKPQPSKPTDSKPVITNPSTKGTPIMGKPVLTAAQLDTFVRKVNPNAPHVAEYFVNLGHEYGLRGDIAFLQAVKETGYFKYGGDVKPEQNNYCGLGAVGGGAGGASFATPRQGVIAQLQHLWAYATKEPLPQTEPLLDPRFNLVTKGIAPTWEQLGGRWAVPGFDKKKYSSFEDAFAKNATYGQEILALYEQASKVKVSPDVVNSEDGADQAESHTRSTTQESVFNTVAELMNNTLSAVIIDGNGYVDASDIAQAFGFKALYDKEDQKIVFVPLEEYKGGK
jgi:N-acetylmuramoyl-L-alanine amidase